MAKNKLLITGVVLAVGMAVFLATQLGKLRDENKLLQKRIEQLAQQNAEIEALLKNVSTQNDSQSLSDKQMSELLRLRSEVGVLREEKRRDKSEIEKLRKAAATPPVATPVATAARDSGEILRKESWVFAGYATPEAAMESWTWSMFKGESKIALDSLAPEMREMWVKQFEGKSDSQIAADAANEAQKIIGYRILSRKEVSENETNLEIQMSQRNKAGPGKPQKIRFLKINGEWKVAGPVRN